MATLFETFRDYEIDLLEMITEQWGIEEDINWHKTPAKQIAEIINNRKLFVEILTSQPESAQQVFQEMAEKGARIAREELARTFGDIREMGAGWREKERPDRSPINDIERLFYRGLIALAFFEMNGDTREYFYIPDEFLAFIKSQYHSAEKPEIGPLNAIKLKNFHMSSATNLVDMLALRLAILRGNVPDTEVRDVIPLVSFPFLDALLSENAVIAPDRKISTEKVKVILLENEAVLVRALFDSWYKSEHINDLRMVPGLIFEGQWVNDPIKPRKSFMKIIKTLPGEKWFRSADLVQWIYNTAPHFMRSGGEYEQWFIKKGNKEPYLQGFSSWQDVDGKYIDYLISGPLAWFGLTRVGYMNGSKDDPIFAKTSLADALINNLPIEIDHATSEKAIIYKNGEIYLPRHAEREMLYHFARFCIWDGKNEKFYKFRMTPTAIRRSEKQDIKIPQIMTILSKYGQDPIPSNIFSALSRWEKSGTMVRIEDQVIVRFKDENILKELTNSSTKKFKIEELNAVTAIIQKRDIHKLENALSEAGYLVENLSQYNDKKKKTDEGSNETI